MTIPGERDALLEQVVALTEFRLALGDREPVKPEWEDYHNTPGGKRLHYPDPPDSGRPSPYQEDLYRYWKQVKEKRALDKAETEARKIVERSPAVKEQICAALRSVSDDIKDIAKLVGAAVLSLMAAGVISVVATPVAVAGFVIMVIRAGVSAFCLGYKA
jgi:hypothetical protein